MFDAYIEERSRFKPVVIIGAEDRIISSLATTNRIKKNQSLQFFMINKRMVSVGAVFKRMVHQLGDLDLEPSQAFVSSAHSPCTAAWMMDGAIVDR